MSTTQRRLIFAAASLVGLLALSACTMGPGASPAPTSTGASSGDGVEDVRPAPPEGRVLVTGTVLDVGGDVQLCVGAVAESYPPQCSGVPVDEWTWDGVDGSETSGDTTWGAYAVYATFDGERFSRTDPPMLLALFDPVRPEDPTGGVEGTSSEAELTRVQDDLATRFGADALSVWSDSGYVWLQVVWDDGSIQAAVDAQYGDDVVLVNSAVREVD